MSQKLALLICANPKVCGNSPTVYVPFGDWKMDLSDIRNSSIVLEMTPIQSSEEQWERVLITNMIFHSPGAIFRTSFSYIGTETSITITITKCL